MEKKKLKKLTLTLSVLVGVMERRVERLRHRVDKDEDTTGGDDDTVYNDGVADGIEIVIEEIESIMSEVQKDDDMSKLADAGLDVLRKAFSTEEES